MTQAAGTDRYRLQVWAERAALADGTYAYWNDESVESDKVWNVERPDGFATMQRYLETSGLLALLRRAREQLAARGRRLEGAGADLACGTCWAARHLLDAGAERLYCVEYSSQRLVRLAPKVLEHDGVAPDRVILCLGSFYELKIPDASLDFVFLAQAFHHADEPDRLLAEMTRVLKPGGIVIIVGEHAIAPTPWLHARHVARTAVQRLTPASFQRRAFGHALADKRLLASTRELLAPDPATGDHFYRAADYARMFSAAGFAFDAVHDESAPMIGYVLIKSA